MDKLSTSASDSNELPVNPKSNDCESETILTKGGIKVNTNEAGPVKVDNKVVKKKMKQAFKSAKSKSLSIKKLRKFVKEHFSKDEETSVKQIMKETIGRGKLFFREGDTITILQK